MTAMGLHGLFIYKIQEPVLQDCSQGDTEFQDMTWWINYRIQALEITMTEDLLRTSMFLEGTRLHV
jgi:hypothetical protein